ncbi:hypothetical protein V8E55_010220 [Tylopilus felleus]
MIIPLKGTFIYETESSTRTNGTKATHTKTKGSMVPVVVVAGVNLGAYEDEDGGESCQKVQQPGIMAQNSEDNTLSGPITFVLSESAWIESLIETGERQHDQLRQRCMRVQQSTEALARNAAERERRFIKRRDAVHRKFIELCSTFSFF